MTTPMLAILAYHKIGAPPSDGWETWNYIPAATFAAHLRWLRDNGWQCIDAAALLRGLVAPESLPTRAALLTFDDGSRTMLDVALPCLREHGAPAVLFVPTQFIGGYNAFDAEVEPRDPICSWDELRELQRHGVSIQSHGVTHRALAGLNTAELAEELTLSKATLETGLGGPVEMFSYPYGDCGNNPAATAAALRQAGYRAACLYGGGPICWPMADVFRLGRVAMGPDTDLAVRIFK